MNDLARAEAYRDQLHDLPDGISQQQQSEIDLLAAELAEAAYFEASEQDRLDAWIEARARDYAEQAEREYFEGMA